MTKNEKKVQCCGSKLVCKASASLQKEIEEDLVAEDKSIKELINDEDKTNKEDGV